jgi:hypothetical protein
MALPSGVAAGIRQLSKNVRRNGSAIGTISMWTGIVALIAVSAFVTAFLLLPFQQHFASCGVYRAHRPRYNLDSSDSPLFGFFATLRLQQQSGRHPSASGGAYQPGA